MYVEYSSHAYRENWSVALAAPAGTQVNIITVVVPPKTKMRLLSFGNYLSVVGNWGLVQWDFLKDGIPLYPYTNILDQIGYAAQRSFVENLIIEGGHIFVIRGQQNTGVACNIGISIEYEFVYEG